jgi:hypothetical protein
VPDKIFFGKCKFLGEFSENDIISGHRGLIEPYI